MEKRVVKISLLTTLIILSLSVPLLTVSAKKKVWELAPFIIDDAGFGDYTWETAVEQPWCKGSGTPEDPYMIKDVIIDGTGSDLPQCMLIQNSNAHFIIMHCTFFGNTLPTGGGLRLFNTYNGKIFKNRAFDNGHPDGPTGAGISIMSSGNNVIQKNDASGNVGVGIFLDNSDNNVIVDNICNENMWGIMLYDFSFGWGSSDYNLISRNECVDNSQTGIVVALSHWNTVTKNLCKGAQWGISVGTYATNNEISKNDCHMNYQGGIIIYEYADFNVVKDNDCTWNNNGILLVNFARFNIIEDNLCKNNVFGISIGIGASYSEVFENDIIENDNIGIVLWTESPPTPGSYPVWGTSIYHNNIIDNGLQALDANPQWNTWNGNYWSDWDGITIPWYYDFDPFAEKNGWE
ncbi:MAG: right-handed parallel beta-helix repeat-containing protein [Candidatus Hodarchaeales archaeon]